MFVPREIYAHRGKMEGCGKACARASEGIPPAYEEESFLEKMLEMQEKVVFDHKVSMD